MNILLFVTFSQELYDRHVLDCGFMLQTVVIFTTSTSSWNN
jgi:hypothetical protein